MTHEELKQFTKPIIKAINDEIKESMIVKFDADNTDTPNEQTHIISSIHQEIINELEYVKQMISNELRKAQLEEWRGNLEKNTSLKN